MCFPSLSCYSPWVMPVGTLDRFFFCKCEEILPCERGHSYLSINRFSWASEIVNCGFFCKIESRHESCSSTCLPTRTKDWEPWSNHSLMQIRLQWPGRQGSKLHSISFPLWKKSVNYRSPLSSLLGNSFEDELVVNESSAWAYTLRKSCPRGMWLFWIVCWQMLTNPSTRLISTSLWSALDWWRRKKPR